jgi:hypothetical protein
VWVRFPPPAPELRRSVEEGNNIYKNINTLPNKYEAVGASVQDECLTQRKQFL